MTDQFAPVAIGKHLVGPNQPVYMIGEIGINHNGDVDIAKQLMDVAVTAGAQAVKFQKRNPEVAVPEHQKSKMRSTPWGEMTYIDYKHRVEFGIEEYAEIDRYAKEVGLQWFASPWDTDSVDFLENEFDALTYKVASASLTDFELLRAIAATGKPVLCSSGCPIGRPWIRPSRSSIPPCSCSCTPPRPTRCRPKRSTSRRSRPCANATEFPSATPVTSSVSRSRSPLPHWAP